jgi:primosomal protein N' (replication factor Y)
MSLFPANPAHLPSRCAIVCVQRGIDHTAKLDCAEGLTYAVPPGIDVAPGQLVQVGLGRGKKVVQGIVLASGGPELARGLELSRLRDIQRAGSVVLSSQLLDLARWMSRYYVCPLGMVLGAMVPASAKEQAMRASKVRTRQQWLVSLATHTGQTPVPAVSSGGTGVWPVPISPLSAKALTTLELLRALPSEQRHEAGLREALGPRWKSALAPLAKQGLLTLSRVAVPVVSASAGEKAPAHNESESSHSPLPPTIPTPTPEQAHVIEGIGSHLGSFGVHLLWGVTGSGKTEVYLRLFERVLQHSSDSTAIALVPEIALTPQTSGRFVARFGPTVAVLHSGLSPKQRAQAWERVQRGEARVVVGPRSAIFAPLSNLSLVVVDEEHDSSYKQDQLPRYHGRDVAIKRAQLAGCPVVLGSATPSLESWHNATDDQPASSGTIARKGPRSTLWKLLHRATGASMPSVRIVDMREEQRLRRTLPGPQSQDTRHLLGPTLEAALHATLEKGEQAMLLLNRRGVARRLHCTSPACGYVLMCDHCDSALVLHASNIAPGGSVVRCHHCNMDQRVPSSCPGCRGKLHSLHAGTQRLEEELERSFASMGLSRGSTLLRLDADSMGSMRDYFRTLGSFARGEAKVLVGTQMLAKGLDFPLVSFVGVLDADTSLAMPDFRSCERTFQLLSQVAGRAGRASRAGLVIIQTHTPQTPVIGFAQRHDFVGFATQELQTRREALLPPFARFAHVVCRDEDVEVATAAADTLASALRHVAEANPALGARVVGPAPCVLARVHDQFRVGIEVYCPTALGLQTLLQGLRERGLLKSDAKTAVDVDAVGVV